MSSRDPLQTLAEKWAHAKAAERANFQPYLIGLCHALGVDAPGPSGSGYEFEKSVRVITRDGVEAPNFLDCWRRDYFAIEAKDEEEGKSKEMLLRRAFGQVRHYASHAPGGLPPYLIVLDVARTAIVWDAWDGGYGDWQAGRRIDLTRLHERSEDAAFLRTIWTDPKSLDPRAKAQVVTKEVAGYLADLARSLEKEGLGQERVARFIMRCVFTMFAEDIGLLQGEPFRKVLERCTDDHTAFPEQATALWKAMDEGKTFDWKQLLRFNGHFFRESEALPLSKQAITVLGLAAAADWQHVEPAIFGTLLTRALDPKERHRLGAEFTPREFVERVVRPTVEEPIREKWTAEQAVVLQLRQAGKKKDAEKRLRAFHAWMKGLRFLDPACGSGNFLYVTLHLVKRIELEVLRELEEVTGKHEMLFDEVHPKQFFGIEIKPWAREIAELVLWIGYHQFWRANHTYRPQEPILEDTGTIECRDAVLGWDEMRHDPKRDRPDPTPQTKHAVSGRMVPDPKARLKYMEYVNPRQAEWPQADFVVGNPPYVGNKRMRDVLGDGYVEALRAAYPDIPGSVDYVMYWWRRASLLVRRKKSSRAGLITTNSIAQGFNRAVVSSELECGTKIAWAVADHPWVDEADGAAVRVAMTVLQSEETAGRLARVDASGMPVSERVGKISSRLVTSVDVSSASARSLLANAGLSFRGVIPVGEGFVLDKEEARQLLKADPKNDWVIRPFLTGRDLATRSRGLFIVNFGSMNENQAREYPVLFDLVRSRVRPERMGKKEKRTRDNWWRFGRDREEMRHSLRDSSVFIGTAYTARHRVFMFLDGSITPDDTIVVFSTDDPVFLGVLSSVIHVTWSDEAGSRLGVGNDPRYNNVVCFDPFPFPDSAATTASRIGDVALKLDAHRKAALDRDEAVTITGMYNVVEKLKSGEALTPKERKIHEIAACGVLKDIHDDLDVLVAKAYGWEWPLEKDVILERLVALHDERVKEEKGGKVRWLRPDYQIPRFGKDLPAADLGLTDAKPAAAKKAKKPAWPADVISQIGAIKRLLADEALSVEDIAGRFTGGKTDIVRRHLDILLVMGEVQENPDGKYQGAA